MAPKHNRERPLVRFFVVSFGYGLVMMPAFVIMFMSIIFAYLNYTYGLELKTIIRGEFFSFAPSFFLFTFALGAVLANQKVFPNKIKGIPVVSAAFALFCAIISVVYILLGNEIISTESAAEAIIVIGVMSAIFSLFFVLMFMYAIRFVSKYIDI